jgi:hypothetical protein
VEFRVQGASRSGSWTAKGPKWSSAVNLSNGIPRAPSTSGLFQPVLVVGRSGTANDGCRTGHLGREPTSPGWSSRPSPASLLWAKR